MTLSPAWLDELRARTTLSAVIGPSVKLIKAGREFKACCPFHNEKTPSFTINDEKGFYHCFGCGAHGDAIRFLTDQRGMPFMDAVKELAAKAGMDVPAPDPRAAERAERSAGLYEVMDAANRWFIEQLDGVDGAAALTYLKERGIDDATRKKFGFGFAPDSRGKLKAALASIGNDKLVEAGLLIAPDDNKQPYDRFRGRLTYPIRDVRGRVIAFSARIIGQGEPKYLNSPDTPLFDKGRTLFNLDLAGPASRAAKRILIVEGQMDVIALDQAGIGEVVAPLGTALTEHQLERLWRLEPAPICCFDGDSAGQKAAIRAALRALPQLGPERTLRFVTMPAGQDPDDLIKAGGRAAMEALLELPEPLVDRLWRHEVDSAPLDTPEARAGLKQRLMTHVQAIGDPNLRQLYRDEFLRRFDALVRPQQDNRRPFAPQGSWQKQKGRFVPPPAPASQAARAIGQNGLSGPNVIALLDGFALFPSALHEHMQELAELPLANAEQARYRDTLLDVAIAEEELDRDIVITTLRDAGLEPPGLKHDKRKGLRFSFVRSETEESIATSQLNAALSALRSLADCEAALQSAQSRMAREFTESAFAEQQRLLTARAQVNDRLASLAGNE